MAPTEEEFLAQLRQTFEIEAKEHTQTLSNGLVALEATKDAADQKEMIEIIFREAHSLKGAARAVNLNEVEQLCQAIETIFSLWKSGKEKPKKELFDSLYQSIDLIIESLENSEEAVQIKNKQRMVEMVKSLEKEEKREITEKKQTLPPSKSTKKITANQKETIRVDAGKLDHLLQQVEEMLIVKLASEQRNKEFKLIKDRFDSLGKALTKLHNKRREIKKIFSSIDPSEEVGKHLLGLIESLDESAGFTKKLVIDLQQMVQESSQDARLTANMVDTLLNDTKKLLMQPFSTLFEGFPRMVRDISHTLNKKVSLETEGGEIDIDRRILEEMKDPLTHLLRNCIDHGIETAEQRQLLAKGEQGRIKISVIQKSGNQVELIISDDGQGIDIEKVKEVSLSQGIISKSDAQQISDQKMLNLIFQSGVSTSSIITDLSGRGLGMGIIAEKVEKLGGNIEVETKKGEGSIFTIHLPLTLATFRGIHVKSNGRGFILPTQNITRTFRIQKEELSTIENKPTIQQGTTTYSFVELKDLLQLPKGEKKEEGYTHVLIVRTSDSTIALGVDEILNEQEVFIKSLGKQLPKIRNISAATILEGGKIVPILDPFDLVKSVITQNTSSFSSASPNPIPTEKETHTVLLAEDSATARILLKNILDSAGYRVLIAVDGMEAYSILKTESIDLLLSDVEMPRMNGFELAEKVRGTEETSNLPIVLCTSLATREDKEKGIEAGANAYIKKSEFTQNQLLDILEQLL